MALRGKSSLLLRKEMHEIVRTCMIHYEVVRSPSTPVAPGMYAPIRRAAGASHWIGLWSLNVNEYGIETKQLTTHFQYLTLVPQK